jgi:hypothetical protein
VSHKRVFKTKTFARWSKSLLPDKSLCDAALEIENGQYEADLGSGVYKKRIALPGMGKSGGTRTLVAIENSHALFFLLGRSKSDPGNDFSDEQVSATKEIAVAFRALTKTQIEQFKTAGKIKEICNGSEVETHF